MTGPSICGLLPHPWIAMAAAHAGAESGGTRPDPFQFPTYTQKVTPECFRCPVTSGHSSRICLKAYHVCVERLLQARYCQLLALNTAANHGPGALSHQASLMSPLAALGSGCHA